MTKKEFKKQFDKAYKMGELEEYVYQILCEEANDYANRIGKSMTGIEFDLLVSAYINGFYQDKRMSANDWKNFNN
jgi:hypothetical protein